MKKEQIGYAEAEERTQPTPAGVVSKKRLAYIDYARGVGILLMIMGHIGFGNVISKWMHAFHMPIFFIMSGYFFKERDNILNAVVRKVKQLLVPYVLIGLIHFMIYVLMHMGESGIFEPLRNLFWVCTNLNMPIAGALWFLMCLFWVDVFFMLLYQYARKYLGIASGLIALLGCMFPTLIHIRLPWAMDAAFVGVGFYFVGYTLKHHAEQRTVGRLMQLSLLESLIGFGVGTVLGLVNGAVNMRTGSYAVLPLSLLNACLLSICVINLCRVAEERYAKHPVIGKICGELQYIGENSIVYLCFNQLCILLIRKLPLGSLQFGRIMSFLICCVVLAVVMVILHNAVRLFENEHLKFLIGKDGVIPWQKRKA